MTDITTYRHVHDKVANRLRMDALANLPPEIRQPLFDTLEEFARSLNVPETTTVTTIAAGAAAALAADEREPSLLLNDFNNFQYAINWEGLTGRVPATAAQFLQSEPGTLDSLFGDPTTYPVVKVDLLNPTDFAYTTLDPLLTIRHRIPSNFTAWQAGAVRLRYAVEAGIEFGLHLFVYNSDDDLVGQVDLSVTGGHTNLQTDLVCDLSGDRIGADDCLEIRLVLDGLDAVAEDFYLTLGALRFNWE